MTTATSACLTTAIAKPRNLDDLVERLGGIPLSRILADPAPGTATEADVLEAKRRFNRLYELVDGVLVEKDMGYVESLLAGALIQILRNFVVPRNLGVVSVADGASAFFLDLIRIPDVAFASWDRFPDRRIPKEPIPSLAPDLVIEVLSESNTGPEMERKRGEYFAAGVRLIWEFDPDSSHRRRLYSGRSGQSVGCLAVSSTEVMSCRDSSWRSVSFSRNWTGTVDL